MNLQQKRIWKSWLITGIKIVLSFSIIIWLVQSGHLDLSGVKYLFTWQYGFIAATLVFLNFSLGSERWRWLLRSQNVEASSFTVLRLSLIGCFFNFAMPGGVGGDMVKAFYFHRELPHTKVIAISSVLIDRILGLYSMILMALLAMLYDYQHVITVPTLIHLFKLILVLFSLASLGLMLIFSKWIYTRKYLFKILQRLPWSAKLIVFYESVHLYGKRPLRVLTSVAISMLSQSFAILFLYTIGSAAGYDLKAATYFLVAPLGFMATAVPLSPAGIGVGQAAFYFLFNTYTGRVSDIGPTTITVYQFATFLLSLCGAYFYIHIKDKKKFELAKDPS
ncbi:MAG: lysylphosphatidylglycerol synthase transmembrane domain-containing protein [Pseudobdellovibrionaceae bacterium]